jgi:1,4-dihydroxy-2-naphthoyl-CoA hydrolase
MAFNTFSVETLQAYSNNTMASHMGIEYTEIGEDFVRAKMLITSKLVQPQRILHGGASVAFAETLGSVAGYMSLPNTKTHTVVGLEINANHIRGVKEGGVVFGECKALHIGRTTIICEIKITNAENKLVCISRITLAVVPLNA